MLLAATRWSFYLEGRHALACMQAAIRVSLAHGVRGDLALLRRFRSIERHRRVGDRKVSLVRWVLAFEAEIAKLDESMRSTRLHGVSARVSRDVRLVYCRYLDMNDKIVARCRRAFAGDFEAEEAGSVALVAGGDDGVGEDGALDLDDLDDEVPASGLPAAFIAAASAEARSVQVVDVRVEGSVVVVDLEDVPPRRMDGIVSVLRDGLRQLLVVGAAATIGVAHGRPKRRYANDGLGPMSVTVSCTLPAGVDASVDVLLGRGGGGADADALSLSLRKARPALDLPNEATLLKALVRDLEKCGAGTTLAEKSRLRSLRKMAGLPPLPELDLPRRQLPRRQLPRRQLTVSDSLNYVVREGGAVVVGPCGDRGPGWGSSFATAGTKCAVVDKVPLDCGTTQCKITRPFEGWINLTDLVPLEGDDDAPALPRARPAATGGGGHDDSNEESSDDEVMDFSGAAAWAASAAARTEHGDDCPLAQ